MTTEKTACILCSRNCGLEVEVEGGQLKKIRGDNDHPGSHGYICNKAARLNYYQNHSGRLQHPLKRQADGGFVQVSWDEALGFVAEKMNKIKGVTRLPLWAAAGRVTISPGPTAGNCCRP